ncbi:MAG: hypothetical protein C0415_01615 [Thermodesulfovibrio sp.]|nr:hypothetical protein [Thermodesulfovibrio sp.]
MRGEGKIIMYKNHRRSIIIRTWLIILLLLIMADGVFAGDNFTGQYKKKNGEINVQVLPDNKLKFWINTVIGMHPCNIGEDGNTVAVFVDSNRAAFKGEQNCVVVLRFEKNKLKVTTKDCDGYCGMHAVGSMDGTYIKKNNRPDFPK